MAKKRERSETEYLRGLVRELESEVRQLKRKAGRSAKKVKKYENLITEREVQEEELPFELPPPPNKSECPECREFLEIVPLGVREMHLCDCGYRKTFPRKS